MIFFQNETTIGLLLASLPAIASVYLFYKTPYRKEAFYLLLFSALLLRLLMAVIDPYLQNWDERFHALVAKSMLEDPFKPMLIKNPLFPYHYGDWWNCHIWVHKQPLFLWQMALSMKIFGVSTFAIRLPSVIIGTIAIWMIREIAQRWTKDEETSFLAALLVTTSWYGLEMISGWMSLDHNDFTFYFYVTAAIWALTRYFESMKLWPWGIITGVFIGCAVLVKWLTAFLVFGGWGLYVLISSKYRSSLKYYLHIFIAFLVSLLVFGPWQLYIMKAFPLESAAAYAYNKMHIVKDLGHEGPWYFHFKMLPWVYTWPLVVMLVIGLIALLLSKKNDQKYTVIFLAMITVLFGFFSYVATKMPAFVFPVSGLICIMMAYGITTVTRKSEAMVTKNTNPSKWMPVVAIIAALICLQPNEMIKHRDKTHEFRNLKLQHTKVYKELSDDIIRDYVIINCPPHENLELMFFRGGNAFLSFPEERVLDSLQQAGHRFAAFKNTPTHELLDYILEDPEVLLIEEELR